MYPVEELAQLSTAQRRFSMLLLGMFAVLAMTLAVVGIYGLMSYSVSQRSHEIGLRMALGSETSRVIRMVIREGLALSGLGVAMGIGYAIAMTRVMSGLLFGIAPTDPLTYAALSLLLITVTVVACYIPARRASRVDPLVALRHE